MFCNIYRLTFICDSAFTVGIKTQRLHTGWFWSSGKELSSWANSKSVLTEL